MIAKNRTLQVAVFFQPRCKLWTCPACAQVNKALWSVRAYAGAHVMINTGTTLYFVTLTSHEKLNKEQSLWVWPRAWAKLRDRMRYAHGGTFHYLMIPEQHADGRLHVHAIESAGVGDRWIRKAARECGLGYEEEEEKLRTPTGAAAYVVKYLSKSLARSRWPRGFRRVRTSRTWPKLPPLDQPENWQFEALNPRYQLDLEIQRLQDSGFGVTVTTHLTAWEMIQTNGEIEPS
jgi:hypothetical protein